MPRACVFGCHLSDKSVSLHTFPKPNKDPERFIVWVNLVNTLIPGKLADLSAEVIFNKAKVCDRHFDVTDWNRNNRLNALAVPSLNLPDFQDGKVIPVPPAKCIKVLRSAIKLRNQNFDDCPEPEYLESIVASDEQSVQSEEIFEPQLHVGYKCNICKGDIVGFRYRCVQCRDLDMCMSCENKGEHYRHYVLRIPEPRDFSEIHSVLEKIREVLMTGENGLLKNEHPVATLDGEEIKIEFDSFDDKSLLFEDTDVKSIASDIIHWKEKKASYLDVPFEDEQFTTPTNHNRTVKSLLKRPILEMDLSELKQVEKDNAVVKLKKEEQAIEVLQLKQVEEDNAVVKLNKHKKAMEGSKLTQAEKDNAIVKQTKDKNVINEIDSSNDSEIDWNVSNELDSSDLLETGEFRLNFARDWSIEGVNMKTYKRAKKS